MAYPKVKWSPTLAAAHGSVTTLEPGQTIELNHVLSGVYNLTESGAGGMTGSLGMAEELESSPN